MLDFIDVVFAFLQYAKNYDGNDSGIERKSLHTLRVAKLSKQIAMGLNMPPDDVDLAWFIGILHDIGRFEQGRRYGTFVDSVSVDHAELGADILFRDGLIDSFPTEGLKNGWRLLCERTVRCHNKLSLPEDFDERTLTFCRLIRDADKADIFRVIATTTFEARVGTARSKYTDEPEASPAVMDCVYEHRCVPGKIVRSVFDNHVAKCCMAFELCFDGTRQIVSEQGFLRALLEEKEAGGTVWNEKEMEQLAIVRAELEKAWGRGI